jgi:hypothetical protein
LKEIFLIGDFIFNLIVATIVMNIIAIAIARIVKDFIVNHLVFVAKIGIEIVVLAGNLFHSKTFVR